MPERVGEAVTAPPRPPRRRVRAVRLRRGREGAVLGAAVVLGCSTAAVILADQDAVVLIGASTVWRAPIVALTLWGASVVILLILIGSALRRADVRRPRPAGLLLLGGALLLVVLASGAWTCGIAVVRAGGDALSNVRLSTLAGTGRTCAVVAEETAFVNTASVRLYPIGPLGIGTPGSATSLGDRAFPVSDHDYRIEATTSGGTLHLFTHEPIRRLDLAYRCP